MYFAFPSYSGDSSYCVLVCGIRYIHNCCVLCSYFLQTLSDQHKFEIQNPLTSNEDRSIYICIYISGEHLWPRSYGLRDGPSLTDLHNIRPADVNGQNLELLQSLILCQYIFKCIEFPCAFSVQLTPQGETNTLENVMLSQASVLSQQIKKLPWIQKLTGRHGHLLARSFLFSSSLTGYMCVYSQTVYNGCKIFCTFSYQAFCPFKPVSYIFLKIIALFSDS